MNKYMLMTSCNKRTTFFDTPSYANIKGQRLCQKFSTKYKQTKKNKTNNKKVVKNIKNKIVTHFTIKPIVICIKK